MTATTATTRASQAQALHRIVARDGTYIAWHAHTASRSTGIRKGAPIVLTNGLGTTENFWKPLVAGLVADRDVVHWDYRGHGTSEPAQSGDYAMATLADDLRGVTEAACGRGTPTVHVGFSMGVTVVLELYRRRPDLVRGLVLIAGGADHPYAASPLFRLPGARSLLRAGLRAASPLVPALAPVVRRALASRLLYPLGRTAGALASEAPREELEHFFRTVGAMDPVAYWTALRALLEAHASDVLRELQVPVLVIAPAKDALAPPRDLEELRAIPGVEWVDVPGTGHAILLEAGPLVAGHVRDFVSRIAPSSAQPRGDADHA
jgi:pimeloyl-ACP methyl ester carboxylesterase